MTKNDDVYINNSVDFQEEMNHDDEDKLVSTITIQISNSTGN